MLFKNTIVPYLLSLVFVYRMKICLSNENLMLNFCLTLRTTTKALNKNSNNEMTTLSFIEHYVLNSIVSPTFFGGFVV